MAAKEQMLLEIHGDEIIVTICETRYYGKIDKDFVMGYYLSMSNCDNSILFDLAVIEDRFEFQRDILGYSTNEGIFPYCQNMVDVIKLVKAVVDYNNRHVGDCFNCPLANRIELRKRLPIKFNFNL